jgi:hypothetical protein
MVVARWGISARGFWEGEATGQRRLAAWRTRGEGEEAGKGERRRGRRPARAGKKSGGGGRLRMALTGGLHLSADA